MLKIIWLMDYAKFWKDKNNTFCDSIKTKNSQLLANKESVAHLEYPLERFLTLTKEITESCPKDCQCNIARSIHHTLDQVYFINRKSNKK